ncbi:hypothetical protein [Streptomyces nitrosporeus]|uniref:hypothetical protein n=1 Tax=Streptomyces nitrosporeus TaxID=28894 RepID=UPI0039A384A3
MSSTAEPDAFGAYTEDALAYELPEDDLDRLLPAFARGLLHATGRILATLAYRDAVSYGDRPFDRTAAGAAGAVLHQMPESCDDRDRDFRARAARAFYDLAEDLTAGRAPLPRCAAEDWALGQMLTLASRVCAASDDELRPLGVPVPKDYERTSYRPPYWEEAWRLLIDGAKYSIPEALPAAAEDDGDDGLEDVPEPEGGWDGPDHWFSPYSITTPRAPQRGHPAWAQAHLDGGPLAPEGPLTVDRASAIMRLGSPSTAWSAYEGQNEYEELAEVLTPLAARLLAAAATNVAEAGWHDLLQYGDRVVERPDEDDWGYDESFLLKLPPICDGQGAAWRLAMVRAVTDLADDLRAGRAPLPRCTAEELAFHLMLREAEEMLDYLDDADYAEDYGLPTAEHFTARHRAFSLWREAFLQDEDVLFHYDQNLAHVAADPEHPASQQLGTGDLRPNAWFVTFGNLRPRDAARGYNPNVLHHLSTADPDVFFASTPALTGAPSEPPAVAPQLRDEFETLVGLAQRRFFDEACAINMSHSIDRLLTLLLDTPGLDLTHVWPRHDRAVAVHAGQLLVDRDFCLTGRSHTWRLHADQNEPHARTWSLKLLDDCAAYVLRHLAAPVPSYMARLEPARPTPDPQLAARITATLNELAHPDTARGTLRHQLAAHKLTCADLAVGAILPEPLIASWLDGSGPVSPAQLVRCAPVLQMPEDVLLAGLGGGRDRYYWPLPQPEPDQLARGE